MSTQLIVFSDLDATLLDRETYSYEEASPALSMLAKQDIPLILNSSKTIAEIAALRQQLKNEHPFVVENGAAVIIPRGYFSGINNDESIHIGGDDTTYIVVRFSRSYQEILQTLAKAKQAGFEFQGFSQWSPEELAEITGLDRDSAERAKQRLGSEPVLLEGDVTPFSNYLAALGLRTVQGGRFLHVMGSYDKADGVRWLLQAYRKKFSLADVKSIALGDSHNDEGMLNCADYPVIIRSPHSEKIHLKSNANARFSRSFGPKGWNEIMQTLVPQLTSNSH